MTAGKAGDKSMGGVVQRICDGPMVSWAEMDVYVGIPGGAQTFYSCRGRGARLGAWQ